MDYTTQMDAARKGIPTEELKRVAEKELFEPVELMRLVAEEKAAIPANRLHTCLEPNGVRSRLKAEVDVNLGASRDCKGLEMELQEVNDAVGVGAGSIVSLSSWGDIRTFRGKLTAQCPTIMGAVPIYDAVVYYHKPLEDTTSQEWLDIIRIHVEGGMDFITIHVGINRQTAGHFKEAKRLANVVSRGGSIILAWMEMTGKESPFYEHFEEIPDICQAYDVTLSLRDACRPGCIEDASDISQIEGLVTLGELARRAWEKNVQAIIEEPGHMPLDQVQSNMRIQQAICQGAPFYVLDPLVIDIVPGYDHITVAIGGAPAAANGAPFLYYVTPAEHLRLPSLGDVKEDVTVFKIAAHAVGTAKGIKGAVQWGREMSTARKDPDWERMFELSIDPERAKKYRESAEPGKEDICSMCGNLCAVRNTNRILDGGVASIFDG